MSFPENSPNSNSKTAPHFSEYFGAGDVTDGFERMFISLWPGWLGEEQYHLLDEVTKAEWSRFNKLISAIAADYKIGIADIPRQQIDYPDNIEDTFDTYEASMDKTAEEFNRYIIPDLGCVISEEWDYTFILWHRRNDAVDVLRRYIEANQLFLFSD